MINIKSLARGAILGVISASLLAGITGCDNKVKECNQLVDKLNATGDKIKALKDPGSDPVKIESAAEKYAAVFQQGKKDIGALHFQHAKLNGFVKNYTNLATQAVSSAHDLEASVKTMAKDSKDVAKEQKALSDGLAALKKQCAKPSDDCAAVGKILVKMPQAKDDKKLLAGFENLSAALDKVKLKNKKVSKAVATYSSDVKAFAKTFAEMGATKDRIDKGSKAQDALDKKEDALVDKVNGYCHK